MANEIGRMKAQRAKNEILEALARDELMPSESKALKNSLAAIEKYLEDTYIEADM